VQLDSIKKLAIGFGNRGEQTIANGGTPGGSGMVFFDDIRLYRARICTTCGLPQMPADIVYDGIIDYKDLGAMTDDWLKKDRIAPPLLTWYKFDGNTDDTTGNGHHADPCSDPVGTFPTYVASGAGFGQAIDVNGGGDYVVDQDAGDYLNGLEALTVALWVKSDANDTDKGFIIFEDPDGDDSRNMRYDSAGASGGGVDLIKCGVTSTAGEQKLESSSYSQTTDWQHLAMTWSSGNDVRLYIDGAEDTPSWREPAQVGSLTGYTKVIVGRGSKDEGTGSSWAGLIDDARIYDRELSQTELQSILDGSLGSVSEYHPLRSAANIYDTEPQGSKAVNLNDYAELADVWLEKQLWPDW
jgi:hypothetical protein